MQEGGQVQGMWLCENKYNFASSAKIWPIMGGG